MIKQTSETKAWPRIYKIRGDGSILLSPELLLVLDWQAGNRVEISIGPNMIEVRKAEK